MREEAKKAVEFETNLFTNLIFDLRRTFFQNIYLECFLIALKFDRELDNSIHITSTLHIVRIMILLVHRTNHFKCRPVIAELSCFIFSTP